MVNPLKNPKRVCLILTADSRCKLKDFPQCADLIVTSPPYADARRSHYDSIHPDKYDEWFVPCLSGLLPIMLSGESTHRCRVSRR